jgi:hypothetical protein
VQQGSIKHFQVVLQFSVVVFHPEDKSNILSFTKIYFFQHYSTKLGPIPAIWGPMHFRPDLGSFYCKSTEKYFSVLKYHEIICEQRNYS